jgi:hypothetical protein
MLPQVLAQFEDRKLKAVVVNYTASQTNLPPDHFLVQAHANVNAFFCARF